MNSIKHINYRTAIIINLFLTVLLISTVAASEQISGNFEADGKPIKATVTLWSTGTNASEKLSETQTGDDGSFVLNVFGEKDDNGVLYIMFFRIVSALIYLLLLCVFLPPTHNSSTLYDSLIGFFHVV